MRHFTKRRPFSKRSSGKRVPALISGAAELPLEFVNRLAVFESLRAYSGRIFRLEAHLQRLAESCAAIGRRLPLPASELKHWLEESLKECDLKEATLRLSLHWLDGEEGEIVLFLREFEPYPAEFFKKGVSIQSAVGRRASPRAQNTQAKSSQYVSGVIAYLDGPAIRPREFIFFGPDGTVAEGTVSNIFIFKRKTLLTPSVASGILKGVTRDFVMELAKKRRWEVKETLLTRHDLYTADECFLTNTSSEVMPVTAMDGRIIGDGKPGKLTQALGRDFKKFR